MYRIVAYINPPTDSTLTGILPITTKKLYQRFVKNHGKPSKIITLEKFSDGDFSWNATWTKPGYTIDWYQYMDKPIRIIYEPSKNNLKKIVEQMLKEKGFKIIERSF